MFFYFSVFQRVKKTSATSSDSNPFKRGAGEESRFYSSMYISCMFAYDSSFQFINSYNFRLISLLAGMSSSSSSIHLLNISLVCEKKNGTFYKNEAVIFLYQKRSTIDIEIGIGTFLFSNEGPRKRTLCFSVTSRRLSFEKLKALITEKHQCLFPSQIVE